MWSLLFLRQIEDFVQSKKIKTWNGLNFFLMILSVFICRELHFFICCRKYEKSPKKSFCRHSISASLLFFVTHRDILFFNIIFSFMFIIFNVNGRDEIFYGILFTRHLQATHLARGLEIILYITMIKTPFI